MAAPCEPEGRGTTAALLCLTLLLLLAGVLAFLLWRYSHVHSRLRATPRRPAGSGQCDDARQLGGFSPKCGASLSGAV